MHLIQYLKKLVGKLICTIIIYIIILIIKFEYLQQINNKEQRRLIGLIQNHIIQSAKQ